MSRNHTKIRPKTWQCARRIVLQRDGYRCQSCGKAGRLEVDHVIPLQHGGHPTAPDNLQTLCRQCHIQKTRAENRGESPERDMWDEYIDSILAKEPAAESC